MKKTALITGASGGLGKEFAKIFAREGYNLVLVARSEAALVAVKEEISGKVDCKINVVPVDLSSPEAAQKLFEYTENSLIHIDVLVNNAGFGDYGLFAEADLDKQISMIRLNVEALTKLTHLYIKPMLAKKSGKILNLGSIASFQPGPLMSVYYATKAYVLSLTEALSAELKGTGVFVSALCPGPTNTGFASNANLQKSGAFKLFEHTTPTDVAEYGYKCLCKNKTIAVHGLVYKFAAWGGRFLPRRAVVSFVAMIQKRR